MGTYAAPRRHMALAVMLNEAKWVSYKLYRHARDHFDRQQPKEKRILEYLLTIRDPLERT